MASSEDEANEFTVVRRQGHMAWRGRPAEERHQMLVLEEHDAEPICGRVAFVDEWLGEVRQGEDRRRGDDGLWGGECRRGLRSPRGPLLAEES